VIDRSFVISYSGPTVYDDEYHDDDDDVNHNQLQNFIVIGH